MKHSQIEGSNPQAAGPCTARVAALRLIDSCVPAYSGSLPMLRHSLLAALLLAAPLSAQTGVDPAGAAALIDQALNHSEVMSNLQYLSDVIGPRLTGSAAARRANDWTAERFRAYGLEARLEPWTFGVTWERGTTALRLLAPFTRGVTGHSWAWTAGTNGKPLAGPVIRADFSTAESLAVYRDKVKGAWILPVDPFPVWNPDGVAMIAGDSARSISSSNTVRSVLLPTEAKSRGS